MAQADGVVANGTGSAVRADINGQLAALFTNHSGSTEPSTTFAFQTWADTNTNTLKLRNSSNDGWVQLARLDGQFDAKTFNSNITLNAQSDLRFADSDSSNWVAFQAPATVASNVTWTLPSADGTADQALTTNGSGVLSWADAGGVQDNITEGNTSAEVVDTGSDGHFKVVTEGTEALRVDSSQRLGIGTSSPAVTVHAEDAQCELQLKSTSGTNSAGLRFVPGGQTNAWYIYANGSRNLVFDDHASERVRINSSGRILVNTSASRTNVNTLEPRVQIEGNNNDTSTVSIIANSTADGTAAQLHLCKSSDGTVGNNGAVVANEVLGRISFDGNDGTNFETGAEILSTMQSNASSGNVSAKLRFYTRGDGGSIREAAQINAGGFTKLKGNYDGFDSENGDQHEILSNRTSNDNLLIKNFNTGFTATNLYQLCARSASSAYAFQYMYSGHTGSTDVEFRLLGDGNAYADGSWNGGGADYAEMFEWSDANPDAEDRRGLSVVLDGDKIREAVAGEEPIGVISGNPSVVGDAAWNKWSAKHLTDDFGSYIWTDHNVVRWTTEDGTEVQYEDWALPEDVVVPDDAVIETHDDKGKKHQHRAVNPAYDPDVTYVSRAERKEWDAVGLMGKLRIRKGQVTGARWIKMRNISDTVEEWLVR